MNILLGDILRDKTSTRSGGGGGGRTIAYPQIKGTFHSTKFSGLKFRVFHATNGTVFSGSKFGAKTEDFFTFVYLLSGCSIDDAEVKINDVLGEGDNTTNNLS